MVEIKAPLWISSGISGCPDPMSFSRTFGCEPPWTQHLEEEEKEKEEEEGEEEKDSKEWLY